MEVQLWNSQMEICIILWEFSYTGDYLNDKKDGPGGYRYANGNIFEGEYKNGVRHGNGFFTDLENETREVGLYVEGL